MLFFSDMCLFLGLWLLRLQNVVTIIIEDLVLIHDIVQDEGLEERTPANNQVRVALVLEHRRVAISPGHGWKAS